MIVTFKEVTGMYMVTGEHWYEHNTEVILGSIGQSEDDDYFYFHPSGHPLEVNQIKMIYEKVYELNYQEFIQPLEGY